MEFSQHCQCPQVPHPHPFKPLQGWAPHSALGRLLTQSTYWNTVLSSIEHISCPFSGSFSSGSAVDERFPYRLPELLDCAEHKDLTRMQQGGEVKLPPCGDKPVCTWNSEPRFPSRDGIKPICASGFWLTDSATSRCSLDHEIPDFHGQSCPCRGGHGTALPLIRDSLGAEFLLPTAPDHRTGVEEWLGLDFFPAYVWWWLPG